MKTNIEYRVLEWRKGFPIQSHKVDGSGLHEDFELCKQEDVYNVFGVTFVNEHLSHLSGEIFTILEAVIDEPRKLKATKDLVRQRISAKMDWLFEQSNYFVDENVPREIED